MMAVPATAQAQSSIVLDEDGGLSVVTTGQRIVHLLDGSQALALPAFSARNGGGAVIPLKNDHRGRVTAWRGDPRDLPSDPRQAPSGPFRNFMRSDAP
jgi:hypothetical protein